MAAKDIPFPDPFLINAPISYPLLKERLAKCARFHKAWKTKSEDSSPLAMNIPSPSDSPNLSSITDPANTLPENLSLPNSNLSNHSNRISTSIIRQFDIPEKVCMIRILPGGQYIVVIDFEENAQFYEVLTGKQVGRQSFSEIAKSEVIYSIDFTVHSKTTVVWGLLTSGMNPHGGDNSSQS
jgi:transposase